MDAPPRTPVVGLALSLTSYEDATERILAWAAAGGPRLVAAANVHMTMEAHDDPALQRVLNERFDMVTPDGMPLVWMLRRLGRPEQERVYGPTLTLHVCEAAAAAGIPIGLYGGTPESLAAMQRGLVGRFPGLRIAYAFSPPFRPLGPEEDAAVIAEIRASGARLLFVGLGCPKQEWWLDCHREQLSMPVLAVGAAFDFFSGRVKQAPAWIQAAGLEWAFRFAMEPRRLWKRYAKNNPRFAVCAIAQLLRRRTR